MSERPRRSTRAPARTIEVKEPTSPSRAKRKAPDVDHAEQLRFMLENPKSALTTMDISDLLNIGSWNMLSAESQAALKGLLPPTAFSNYSASLSKDHPSVSENMDIDSLQPVVVDSELNSNIFTDSHFLAAAHTFQDHLHSDWLSQKHAQLVNKFEVGVQDGSLAAPWKDETWERDNIVPAAKEDQSRPLRKDTSVSLVRAGGAAEIKLNTLAENAIIRVGDVISYKRHFSVVDIVVEKDVIVQSIHPTTHALTVLAELGPNAALSSYLLLRNPGEPTATVRSMTVSSLSMLETGLLDIDGRVDKSSRPNGNAWKKFTIWRWRDGGNLDNEKGGRESHGTMFYLRGCFYHEQ